MFFIPGLGVGLEGAAGEKNMHDAEFTCALFRFIQLTCEGHNLGELTILTDFKKKRCLIIIFCTKHDILRRHMTYLECLYINRFYITYILFYVIHCL